MNTKILVTIAATVAGLFFLKAVQRNFQRRLEGLLSLDLKPQEKQLCGTHYESA